MLVIRKIIAERNLWKLVLVSEKFILAACKIVTASDSPIARCFMINTYNLTQKHNISVLSFIALWLLTITSDFVFLCFVRYDGLIDAVYNPANIAPEDRLSGDVPLFRIYELTVGLPP